MCLCVQSGAVGGTGGGGGIGWVSTDVTRVFARMAESSRAKVKEVDHQRFTFIRSHLADTVS